MATMLIVYLHVLSQLVYLPYYIIILSFDILQESNFAVENVQHQGKFVFHIGTASGSFKVGDEVILCIDVVRYSQCKQLNNNYL